MTRPLRSAVLLFCYGHLQIALAAAGLGWLSVRLSFGSEPRENEFRVLSFLFFATFGVYTLHRYLSFRRAGVSPRARRYALVRNRPRLSLGAGLGGVAAAVVLGLPYLRVMLVPLLLALPLTVFYLTPPRPGWRRLRDFPFVKVVWVALAWTLMTHELPVRVVAAAGGVPAPPPYPTEWVVRFCFILAIAVLFDFRDIALDRAQGVRTLAGRHPTLAYAVAGAALVLCATGCALGGGYARWEALVVAYGAVLPLVFLTHPGRREDWFAVAINGALWLPPLAYAVVG